VFLWQLFLSLNIFFVSYLDFSISKLARLEPIYHIFAWGLPLIIPFVCLNNGTSISPDRELNFGFYTDGKLSLLLFYLPIWLVWFSMFLIYVIVGRKVWWTPANLRYTLRETYEQTNEIGISPRRTTLLKSTGPLIFANAIFMVFPTVYEVYPSMLFYTLKTLSLGSIGFFLSLMYLHFTMESIQSVKDYLKQSYNIFIEANPNAQYTVDERVPLLKKNHEESPKQHVTTNTVPPGTVYEADYNFEPSRIDEIKLVQGDRIIIIASPEGGWWKGQLIGGSGHSCPAGWFPCNYVSPYESEETLEERAHAASVYQKFNNGIPSTSSTATSIVLPNRLTFASDQSWLRDINDTRILLESTKASGSFSSLGSTFANNEDRENRRDSGVPFLHSNNRFDFRDSSASSTRSIRNI
jgi:hypothetical protein